MAINSGEHGHSFDPSKRIIASLGNEFVQNTEAEAVERLAQAMATNATKNNKPYEEENTEMNIKDIFGKVEHSNPMAQQKADESIARINNEESAAEEQNHSSTVFTPSSERYDALLETEQKLNKVIAKKPFNETTVRAVSGFGIHDSKATNTKEIANYAIKNIASFIVNDGVETTFRYNKHSNDFLKNTAISTGIAAGVDFVSSTFMSVNNDRFDSLFDKNIITKQEADMISSVAKKEKIKFGIEHTVASVVLPSLAKMGIHKLTKDSELKDNKLFEVATSFGVLSTIGKVGLNVGRRIAENKLVDKMKNTQFTIEDGKPSAQYKNIAKIAVNHLINESVEPELLGATAGSVVGFTSVVFVENEETYKKIKNFENFGSTSAAAKATTVAKPVPMAKPTSVAKKPAASK